MKKYKKYAISLHQKFFLLSDVNNLLEKFFGDIISSLPPSIVIKIIFKVKFEDGEIKSFSKIMLINNDLNFKPLILSRIKFFLDISKEEYHS